MALYGLFLMFGSGLATVIYLLLFLISPFMFRQNEKYFPDNKQLIAITESKLKQVRIAAIVGFIIFLTGTIVGFMMFSTDPSVINYLFVSSPHSSYVHTFPLPK